MSLLPQRMLEGQMSSAPVGVGQLLERGMNYHDTHGTGLGELQLYVGNKPL